MLRLGFLVLLFVHTTGCGGPDDWEPRLQTAAVDLLKMKTVSYISKNADRPVKDIVNVGPGLAKMLQTRTTPIEDLKITVADIDLFKKPRFGWLSEAWDFVSTAGGWLGYYPGVTHSIKYDYNKGPQNLILRLRYSSKYDAFHILGYSGHLTKEKDPPGTLYRIDAHDMPLPPPKAPRP
jgi:hypothetical protein